MKKSASGSALRFVASATFIHAVTYFIFGIVFSSMLDYPNLFGQPVIRDYYRPFGSVSNYIGPLIQIARGALFGVVLLPFRKVMEESRYGWLYVWALFVGVGILGTPAAAPSSIEGLVYTRLPTWFHLIGFPEILSQTLAFSLLLRNSVKKFAFLESKLAVRAFRAISRACFSFIGYTVVSIAFALSSGVGISEGGSDPKVLGQFIAPLALTFIAALSGDGRPYLKHLALYVLSASALAAYQALALGDYDPLYAIVAPVLPVAISLLSSRKGTRDRVA